MEVWILVSLRENNHHNKSYFHWPPCNPSCTKEEVIYQGSAWACCMSFLLLPAEPSQYFWKRWNEALPCWESFTHTHALLPLFEATEQQTITIKLLLPSTKRPLFLTLCSPPLPPPPPHPLLPPHTFHASISIPPTNLPIPPALFCLCCNPPCPLLYSVQLTQSSSPHPCCSRPSQSAVVHAMPHGTSPGVSHNGQYVYLTLGKNKLLLESNCNWTTEVHGKA